MKKINCILLVDDDLAGNAFHTIIIRQSGNCNQVRTANSGPKALDYIQKSIDEPNTYPEPDLIYLDINMPGMNGFEFMVEYDKLKGKLLTKPVIIMLTTSLNPDDKKQAAHYHEIIEFQNKPLTSESLREAIGKYFEVRG